MTDDQQPQPDNDVRNRWIAAAIMWGVVWLAYEATLDPGAFGMVAVFAIIATFVAASGE